VIFLIYSIVYQSKTVSDISDTVVARWQDRWDNSTTGRVTYEMIAVVGYKTTYPRNRCIAVSYARLLVHDTSLKDHQYRLGLEDTRLCECGQGIEDDYHFFFDVQGTRTVEID